MSPSRQQNRSGVAARTTGFTLVELLTVVVIIAVLAAILFPALARAKDQAIQTRCMSNMRQLTMVVMLYRTEYDGDGKYGTIYEMGLPTAQVLNPTITNPELFHCGGKVKYGSFAAFTYFPIEPELGTNPPWHIYSLWAKEESIIYSDINHDRTPGPENSPFVTHTSFGVNLMGSAVRRKSKGSPSDLVFWYDGPAWP